MADVKKEKEPKFEDALKRLEDIVAKLESGEIALEQSLLLFEEGIRLSKFCSKKLNEAEKRISILTKPEDGKLEEQPFGINKEDNLFNNDKE